MSSGTVVLIDAYSQIFRAFYALRTLSDSSGRPTNAIFVFTRLLIGIERQFSGELGGMCFDCGKVAFRLALNAAYKANRPPMPEALSRQIPAIGELIDAFGWPRLQAVGYEADDLIGGFCRSLEHHDIKIISSDKDLSQLVDDHARLLVPAKGGTFEERGRDEVMSKFGVPPELMADYLALVGDSSDNIAGVPGIGPKSAAELLNSCGPIENWLSAPEKLPCSRYAAKLAGHDDLLRRNLQLVRLRTELPEQFAIPLAVLKRKKPDWERIAAICRDHELKSILRELPQGSLHPTPDAPDDLFAAANLVPEAADNDRHPNEAEPQMVQGELF